MFVSKEYIKKQVIDIVQDDADNDIIFIVASKGVGKLKLLNELYDFESFQKDIVVADGKKVRCSCSCLKKCFIDGIYSYLKRNNTFKIRYEFCKLLSKYNISFQRNKFTFSRKFNISTIALALYQLPTEVLKEVYIEIAEDTPLVLFASAITLCDDDIKYLRKLKDDTWGARITFVIAIRPSEDALTFIHDITIEKEQGIWVFPLLPDISVNTRGLSPTDFASITINNHETSLSYSKFKQVISSHTEYFDMYDFIQSIIGGGLKAYHLFFLANQEMTIHDYEYVQNIAKMLYQETSKYEKQLILPYNGKLLWIDALSYYLVLNEGIEEALSKTQKFFFDVLLNAEKFVYGRPKRNEYSLFLRDTATPKNNLIAHGFSNYFSNFAKVITLLSVQVLYNHCSLKNSLLAIELLDRITLEFSETNIAALSVIYEYTQVCTVLDMGLDCIKHFFDTLSHADIIPQLQEMRIAKFQSLCLAEAYHWLDITLIDGIVNLQKSIVSSGRHIRFEFKDLTTASSNHPIFKYLLDQLNKHNLKIGDVIMPKNTVFLSYAHADEKIAELIDNTLQSYGYHVVRDVRDVKPWDSLKQFMQSIRKQDFVVLLVSDTYLHSENCMYEVMQLLKDESFSDRAFPIAINFPKTENKSMFKAEYWADIVMFWQEQADNLKQKIEKLSRENSAGLDLKYRDIKNMAQNADEFLQVFFNNFLLGTLNPEEPQINKIVEEIDSKIQRN